MSDDIEAQLAALEEKAPLTDDGDDGNPPAEVIEHKPYVAPGDPANSKPFVDPAAEAAKAAGEADPTKANPPVDPNAAPADDHPELATLRQKLNDKEGLAKKERELRRQEQAARQQMASQFEQQRQEMARLQAVINQITNPAPDPEVNVVEALKYTQAQLAQRQQADLQRFQQQQQINQQNAFVNNLKTTVEDFEAEFAESQPDYHEASDWLVDMEQKRMEALGLPPAQAEQMAIRTAIQMANMAVQNGRNPAEVAWNLAQQQGWKKAGAAPAAGAQPAAGAAPNVQQQAAEKLAQLRAGQDAAKTMNGGGNPGSGGPPSLKDVLNLHGAAAESAQDKWLDDMIKGRSRG